MHHEAAITSQPPTPNRSASRVALRHSCEQFDLSKIYGSVQIKNVVFSFAPNYAYKNSTRSPGESRWIVDHADIGNGSLPTLLALRFTSKTSALILPVFALFYRFDPGLQKNCRFWNREIEKPVKNNRPFLFFYRLKPVKNSLKFAAFCPGSENNYRFFKPRK